MMLKLIKYEYLKRLNILLIALGSLIVFEIAYILTLVGGFNWLPISLLLAVGFPFILYLLVLVDNIYHYSADLNQKSGYMLFLTPTSGYQIIGSKLIYAALETLICATIAILSIWVNYKLGYHFYAPRIDSQQLAMIESIFNEIRFVLPGTKEIVIIGMMGSLQWFTFLTTIFAAITLRKTLLSNAPLKGLFSFFFFIALNTFNELFSLAVLFLLGFTGDIIALSKVGDNILPQEIWPFLSEYFLVAIGIYAFLSTGYAMISGRLLNTHVDL